MFSSGASQTGLCVSVPGSYPKTSSFENLGKIKLNMFLYQGPSRVFNILYHDCSPKEQRICSASQNLLAMETWLFRHPSWLVFF